MTTWDDTDYAPVATTYAVRRQADPVVAAQLLDALGGARTVLNVGAGAGSYEPTDRYVAAVEPSAQMRAKRAPSLVPAIDGTAEHLPFDDDAFEAALAVFTVHHWPDLDAGLREVRRVTAGPVVVMTADPDALAELWLAGYSPQFHETERRRYPTLARVESALGPLEVRPLRIPLQCTDGFADAYYGRPEALLDPDVRAAMSAWSFVSADDQESFASRLRTDLDSGAWDASYGHLRSLPEHVGSIRILLAR